MYSYVGCVAVALVGLVGVDQAAAADGIVEAVGEAQIKDDDRVAAKKAATLDALTKCIEKVVGITIKSDFSSEMQETVRDNQSAFNAKVKETLTQKAEGFVDKYDVLDERVDGEIMKVEVRARVYESKVKAEVKKLADLIAAAGNPKLMIVIQDIYIKDGKKTPESDSVLAAIMEKELLKRGFEIKGKHAAQSLADGSLRKFEKWMENPARVTKMASESGADVVIYGQVEIRDKGKISEDDSGGLSALVGQTRIEISAVIRGANAATGEVFSSKPVQMSSMGINLERAAHRALKGRGRNLVRRTFDDVLEDLKESFRKIAKQGQSYVISLSGVTSFRKQGRRFVSMLGKLSGVSSVKQKSFESGNLVIDLRCKCSAGELQDLIFTACEAESALENVDIETVAGGRLSFKL